MKIHSPSPQTRDERFDRYLALLSNVLDHADRIAPMRDYLTGLLLSGKRKSIEPIAARIDPSHVCARHQSLHHFISVAAWSDQAILRAIRLAALPAVLKLGKIESWIVDDTGFPKRGKYSVGVARQYCGQLGKTDNCQVAVSLTLAHQLASLPVAFELFLPEKWANDWGRRKKAGVPSAIRFRTKPEIALDQIVAAVNAGLPRGIVNADTAFGNNTAFRESRWPITRVSGGDRSYDSAHTPGKAQPNFDCDHTHRIRRCDGQASASVPVLPKIERPHVIIS